MHGRVLPLEISFLIPQSESTTCSESAATAASHTSQRDSEGIQGTQHGSTTWWNRTGKPLGDVRLRIEQQVSKSGNVTEMRQEAQQSSI